LLRHTGLCNEAPDEEEGRDDDQEWERRKNVHDAGSDGPPTKEEMAVKEEEELKTH
jgi:hypothetical protein